VDVSRKSSQAQTASWNSASAQSWVEAQDLLNGMYQPFEDLLIEAAAAKPRACVLDVGCGTGSTIIAIERRLGAGCRCVGIDISEPMLEQARLRAERAGTRVSFICADAELHSFERGSFDLLLSRFGVMFFNDPVRALANLRHAARDDAELCFIVWRGPAENPFMTVAEQAAADILPHLPAREPDAPGQFGFADSDRVRRILEQSGWTDIDIRPLDVECSFPEADLVRYAMRLGPVGRSLQGADEQTQQRVLAVVRPALEPYVHGATVRFRAACWRVGARARPSVSDTRAPDAERTGAG
jgi:ubiquinone/menaquinone biosynthesis C-methylase UbiE